MSQPDEKALEPQDEPKSEADESTTKPSVEEDEFNFEIDEDRQSLYERLDKANEARAEEKVPFQDFLDLEEEDADEDDPEGEEEPSGKDAPETVDTSEERTGETKEPQLGGKVLSREEFEEVFKDIKIKTKIAGEEVEAPVKDFLKATGLEKHWTKRLQELSRREREILQNRPDYDEGTGEGPSEEEIEEKYNELYEESPYKAQKYLDEVEKTRETSRTTSGDARIQKAVEDFKSVYPECTDDEWVTMNDPKFWQSHEDIVKMKDAGDTFATLVTAYTRLQQSKVTAQAIDDGKKKPPVDKTERKKKGQVVRTSIKPIASSSKKKGFELERPQDYIAALRKQARDRMGIQD
jgi:hypothetical protein